MIQLKQFFVLFLLFFGSSQIYAQLVEGTPCTATCLDPLKSTITGRQPNQNGSSPNMNLPCGSGTSEDNPAWWILRPSGTTLTFSVTTSNCLAGGCGLGVQMTLWEGDSCGSVTAIDCVVGTSGSFTSSVSPCKVYYLQIDGLCECQCNVIVTYDKNQILKEVPKPEIRGPKQICKDLAIKYAASVPSLQGCRPDLYNWTLNPASAGTITKTPGVLDSVTVKITNPPANGKVQLCAEPKFNGKCPPKTNKECVEIEVIELKPATCNVDLCPEEQPVVYELIKCMRTTNPTFNGIIKPEIYTIDFPVGTKKTVTIPYVVEASGCASEVKLNINVFDNKPVVLPPLIFCEGETKTVKGIEFSCADASINSKKFFQEGNPKPIRCDTAFQMLVQCIKVLPKITGIGTLDCSKTSLTLNAAGIESITFPNSVTTNVFTGVGTRQYAWSKDGNAIAGATNATLLVTAPGLYEVTLTYTYEITQNINGIQVKTSKSCSKTAQVQIDGIPGSAVAETPNALSIPCKNGTATYAIQPDPNATGYQWSVVGGGATIVGSSMNPANLIVQNTGLPYQVCLVKTACNKTSVPNCIDINVKSTLNKPIVFGKTTVCQDDKPNYLIANASSYAANVDFIWIVTGGTISAYNSDSTEVIIQWKNAGIGEVAVIVNDNCSNETSKTAVLISPKPNKPTGIDGKKIVCENQVETYKILPFPVQNASSYKWYLSGGGTISSSDTAKTIAVKWTETGKFQLCVKAVNDCFPTGSDTLCFDVEVKKAPQPNAGLNRKICGLTTNLNAQFTNGSTGKWSIASPAPGTATFDNVNSETTMINVSVCGLYKIILTETNAICSVSDTAEINFSKPPTMKNLIYTCNNSVSPKTYDVTLVMEGCYLPLSAPTSKYPATVDPSGTIFTILNVPQTDIDWSLNVSNTLNCSSIVNVKADCSCITRAGTMKLEPTIKACAEANSTITATHNDDDVNDGDDAFSFILHEGKGGSILFPIAENKTGEFAFDSTLMQCDTTYYISYYIGNDKNGLPDPNDKCLQVTPQGQPVRWDCKPNTNLIISSNSPICEGETLVLISVGSTNITWTGPDGFSSNLQNPTIPNVSLANKGVYSAALTNPTVCSDDVYTSVKINPKPQVAATCNTPVCAGETVYLVSLGGTSYNWSGPDNFQSSLQNPILTKVEAKNAGNYTVTVSDANNCKNSATTALEIKNCVATNDFTESANIQLFPNPVQEQLMISANIAIQKVEIFNSMGQLLLSQKADNQLVKIKMAELSSGFYFTKIFLDEKNYQVFKVVKE